jgi:hypothetical protein
VPGGRGGGGGGKGGGDGAYDDDFEEDSPGRQGPARGGGGGGGSPSSGGEGGEGGGGGQQQYNDEDYYSDQDDEAYRESALGRVDGRLSPGGSMMSSSSRRVMERSFQDRHQVKQSMLGERTKFKKKVQRKKVARQSSWRRKMEKSPFLVDLLAENERIDEENKIRIRENMTREKGLNRRKEKVKNEIILKALAEASDLEALRQEKRLIATEEKRLKALLDLEKTNGHRKGDLLAAQRAERQRKQVQAEYRRQQVRCERAASWVVGRG